ncbi:MAG TPA: hypothetical protein VKA48_09750, partial [Gammaproteobacteria bacterium]|nr:hypothetical protein [Gammaproteobacteria bacterium]
MSWRKHWLPAAILAVLLQALVSTVAVAAVHVGKVELFQKGGHTGLLVTGDGALTYRLLSQQDPPRVLIQLPGSSIDPSALPEVTSKGLVRNVKLHPGNGKPPRLEVLLAKPARASADREGSALTVTFSPKNGADGKQQARQESQPKLQDYTVTPTEHGAQLLLKTSKKV